LHVSDAESAVDRLSVKNVSTGAVTSAAYDDANQRQTLGGNAYDYDRNGNLTSYGPSTNPAAKTLTYERRTSGRAATSAAAT
jgi:hypothetical protein